MNKQHRWFLQTQDGKVVSTHEYFFFFQAEDGIRDLTVTGVQTCALPISVYDHFGDLFQTGYISDNNLTISGGNDRTLFYLSGEGMYNRGDMIGPNNHYQRATVRLKGEHRVRDNLTVRGNVAYSDDRGAFIQKGSNISGLLLGSLRTDRKSVV